MATNAASLPPEDGAGQRRVEPSEPPPPPPPAVLLSLPPDTAMPAAAAPPPTTSPRRPPRVQRTIDLERVRELSGGSPVVVTWKLRWWVTLLIAVLFVGPLAFGGVAVYHSLRSARDEPQAPAATPAQVVDVPFPTLASAVPSTAAPAGLPLGAASLLDPGIAAALAPLLDQALPGEPTQFTSIDVHPDSATTIVRDVDDPTRTQRFTWRPDGVTAEDPQQETVDIGPSLFTVADVDWNAIARLVATAPALLHVADQPVTHVVVQRWGFDPAYPMRFLVYVADGSFVEASADGTVLAVH